MKKNLEGVYAWKKFCQFNVDEPYIFSFYTQITPLYIM